MRRSGAPPCAGSHAAAAAAVAEAAAKAEAASEEEHVPAMYWAVYAGSHQAGGGWGRCALTECRRHVPTSRAAEGGDVLSGPLVGDVLKPTLTPRREGDGSCCARPRGGSCVGADT